MIDVMTDTGGDESILTYAITYPAAGTYTITAYVYIQTAFTANDAVYLSRENFAGDSWTEVTRANQTNGLAGYTVRLECRHTVAGGDLVGNLLIKANCVNLTAFSIDAVQFESGSTATTYFDGDQPDCYWTGADHASTSVRPATSRRGGYEYDLFDQYGYTVRASPGIGAPQSTINYDILPNAPGGLFQSRKILPRTIDLTGYLRGTSFGNLSLKRKNLWEAIKPWPLGDEQPVTLRYTGSNSSKPLEITCYYDSGMEFNNVSGPSGNKIEQIPLRLIAMNPHWQELPEYVGDLLENVTPTLYYMAGLVQGDWTALGASAFNGAVNAVAVDHVNGYLYVGGDFTAPHTRIARYNLNAGTWSALGTGCNGSVKALYVDGTGGLIVGGAFTTANAVTVNGIARWNGTTFTAYGTGVAGGTATVWAVLVSRVTGYIYIAGDFTSADGDTNCNSMAFWSGADWDPMVTGTASICRALAEDPSGNIYIGGEFTDLSVPAGDYVIKWDGTAFSPLSTGLSGICHVLHYGGDGNLYLGGAFTSAGGVTVNKVAIWNGDGFEAIGSGVDSTVYALKFHDGIIYVGGIFTAVGGSARVATGFAVWNGTTWEPMPIVPPGTPTIRAIDVSRWGDIYIGFDTTGASTASDLATIAISGTEPVYPRFVAHNTHASTNSTLKYLENYTTGVKVWFTYTLKPGEKITVDFHPHRYSVTSNIFGALPGIVDDGSDTSFQLEPGNNSISCLVYGGTPVAYLLYRPCHALVDGVAV